MLSVTEAQAYFVCGYTPEHLANKFTERCFMSIFKQNKWTSTKEITGKLPLLLFFFNGWILLIEKRENKIPALIF